MKPMTILLLGYNVITLLYMFLHWNTWQQERIESIKAIGKVILVIFVLQYTKFNGISQIPMPILGLLVVTLYSCFYTILVANAVVITRKDTKSTN